jgi:hypothetical protein
MTNDLIQIDAICEFEGFEAIWYQCKDHVDKSLFVDAMNAEFGKHIDEEKIIHGYAINVPAGRELPGQMVIYLKTKPGRGRYKITYFQVD